MADRKKAAKKPGTSKPDGKTSGKKIIAVVGATGAQGGGLVRAILDDKHGGFAARAITRDPNSDKAKALADAGAEVVGADVDNEKSLGRDPSPILGDSAQDLHLLASRRVVDRIRMVERL